MIAIIRTIAGTAALSAAILLGCGDGGSSSGGEPQPEQKPEGGEETTGGPPSDQKPESTSESSSAGGSSLSLLGVQMAQPAGYVLKKTDASSVEYEKAGKASIFAYYNFNLVADGADAALQESIQLDDQGAVVLQPQGEIIKLGDQAVIRRFTSQGTPPLTAYVGGRFRPSGSEDIGAMVVVGVAKGEDQSDAIKTDVEQLIRSIKLGPIQQYQDAVEYLGQGQWHREEYYYSPGGVGSGSSTTHHYYCFVNGFYAYGHKTNISIDVSGGSGYGGGEGDEKGRVLIFGKDAQALVVMVNSATGAVSTMEMKLMPNDSAFKVGEKGFYQLTTNGCQ